MRPALVVVHGGRSIPSLVSAEDEAELVRGATRVFRFELVSSDDAVILEALRDLASHYPEHAAAKRIQGLYGKPDSLVWKITGKTIDELEKKRLEAERAEWLSAQGGAS